MQGRRDFAFGLDQATRAYTRLAGPKRLWIGNHGHAPSTFPTVDSQKMLAEGKLWFDRFLRGVETALDDKPRVVIATERQGDDADVRAAPAGPPRRADHRDPSGEDRPGR